jgi:hypothetical protein
MGIGTYNNLTLLGLTLEDKIPGRVEENYAMIPA